MPLRTACLYCGRVGFVRIEHVVQGRTIYRQCYCGVCDRTWKADEPPPGVPRTRIPGRKKTRRR